MFRTPHRALGRLSLTASHLRRRALASASFSEHEVEQLKKFASTFRCDAIPINKMDIVFSRSSGAGGQNVNKVATKVDMRFVVSKAEWLPLHVRGSLAKRCANRVNKKGELVVTSERYRTQAQNMSDCVEKLHRDIIASTTEIIPLEPDEEKEKRINELKHFEFERNARSKQYHSKKKSERRSDRDY
ncbi:hypothetical protein BC830DRAFT_1065943 [Chytriomyces sp. MP71]|nr:hypothetical protein BC830DRAFT_1065943 [Chytriomyces sp. MP71]